VDGVLEQPLHLALDLVVLVLGERGVQLQPGVETLDRVASLPLLEQLPGNVRGVVVHRMALHAQGQTLDQGRASALARLLDRQLRLPVDGENVRPVHDDALEAVGLGTVGDLLARVLEVCRCRVSPLVVVADEDHGQLPYAREVHPLMGVAPGGRSVAEPRDGDALLTPDPERKGAPDRDREHRR
jgi:hypothetical protein